MAYNFDEIVERRGTDSLKWDTVKDGVIPLWVADMDFPCLPELRRALAGRAEHPFYGYRSPVEGFYEAVHGWYQNRYGLELERAAVLSGPGTVLSLGIAVREFSAEGDGVLLLTPVYTPFFEVVNENRRRVVDAPLYPDGAGRFALDIPAIEAALDGAAAGGIRVPLVLFCSPHNPGGRVWSRDEIAAFLDMAERRNMIVVSDEIHGDFVYDSAGAGGPARAGFVSAAALTDHAGRVIVVSGANKSFNLGGLHISHFVIRDENLRRIVQRALHREAAHQGDVFAELAVETVYRYGGTWLDELRDYLWKNLSAAVDFLNAEVPGLRAFTPDGTYLLWARARDLAERTGCGGDAVLVRRLEDEGRVRITPGSIYGKAGEGHVRINFASPRRLLMEGLSRLADWAQSAVIK
ncbi:MAG: aminotransferase class I/II-fold pyridoxal phosphate-dependent enzyme [Treponema sp.]|jgi:cystathionine beta-lyase|nr:aminotransferase class I/II-fold pyridoxal phosphate-dependent enzyme [Treponema sp.]